MIQLSLPTRVTPASWTVAQFSVQNSRMVLPLPISSRVGSSLYFLSCGEPPRDTWGWMRLLEPMRVCPAMTVCVPTVVPAPISTCGPMTAYGPTSTSGAERAFESTRAVEWIFTGREPADASRSVERAYRAHDLRLGGQDVAHHGLRGELPDPPHVAVERHVQAHLIAGHDRLLEAGVVD